MGCFNGTCGVSNLPIHVGNKIYLFLLRSSGAETQSIACQSYEPDDLYKPLGFPIECEYNDYGSIENIIPNSVNERYFKEQFKYYQRNNSGDYEPYVWLSFERFCEDVIRDGIWIEVLDWDYASMYKEERPKQILQMVRLEYMMVHKPLYDRLLMSMANRIPYNKTETFGTYLQRQVESRLQKHEQGEMSSAEIGLSNLLSFYTLYSGCFDKSMNYFANVYMTTKAKDIVESLRDFMLWRYAMMYMRKGYHCFSGLGSQSSDYELHKIIAEFVLETYKNRQENSERVVETIFWSCKD